MGNDMNGAALVSAFGRDLRYAIRVLSRTPAFTTTAIVTLALAIGANTAVFSLVDAILIKPLPYPEPDRLGYVVAPIRTTEGEYVVDSHNGTTWGRLRDNVPAIDAAVTRTSSGQQVNLVVGDSAASVRHARVGAGFYWCKGDPLVVSLADSLDTARIAASLAGQLDLDKFEVKQWNELTDFYDKTVTLYDRQFGVLRLIILIMVLLGVANSVNMGVFERVGEFGTMMALGNRRLDVFRLVMLENVIIGLIGSAAGLLMGVLLAWSISALGIPMPPPPSSEVGYMAQIRVVPKELVLAFVVGFVATVTAAVLPARRVARIPVAEALRQNV